MLVLFIYITSLASNEIFSLSIKLIIKFFIIIIINFLLIIIIDKNTFLNLIINRELTEFNSRNIFIKENSINLNKLYNYPSNFITIFLINYLFFTLVVVVKITNFFSGPLRTIF